jgi:hypothetical protein
MTMLEGPVREPRAATLARQGRLPPERVALVDLLDRLLAGGVVITGDVVLSIADIELVRISLRALIMSVREPDDVGKDDVGPDDAGLVDVGLDERDRR